MKGPCLCGDPYCPSCGSPELVKIEAAEEAAIEELSRHNLTADEYALCVRAGLSVVMECRDAVDCAIKQIAANEAEAASMQEGPLWGDSKVSVRGEA
jgi:hypothetical protein